MTDRTPAYEIDRRSWLEHGEPNTGTYVRTLRPRPQYVEAVERAPVRKRKRGNPAAAVETVALAEARRRVGTSYFDEPSRQEAIARGRQIGGDRRRERSEDTIRQALQDPAAWRIGARRLVTGCIERSASGHACFDVVCEGIGSREGACGETARVLCRDWVNRSTLAGRACGKCMATKSAAYGRKRWEQEATNDG